MAEAMAAGGFDAAHLGRDDETLRRVGTFVELHVEQGRALVDQDAPVGVASAIWPHGRWRLDLAGRADHAGTTRLEDRDDPMLRLAAAITTARSSAERHGTVATVGKVRVEPNGVNAIPSAGHRLARRPRRRHRRRARGGRRRSARLPGWSRSRSRGRRRPTSTRRCATGWPPLLGGVPVLATGAGHDAGILSAAGIPTAMLFVRNPTGITHSPGRARRRGRLPGRRRRAGRRGRGARVTTYWCEHAWLPDGRRGRRCGCEVDGGRHRCRWTVARSPQAGDVRLAGLVLPGLANAHSHAFHRALRGRTHDHGGTFWTWRERMYAVADRLDPDTYLRLAPAVYAEMALAGITAVGEFHYLHHGPGGVPYDDPNAMGLALVQAAGATPASGSPCSTPATSPAGSDRTATCRSTRCSNGSPTAPSSAWRERASSCSSAPATVRTTLVRRRGALGAGRAGPTTLAALVDGARPADRCTSTCPSSRPRTTRAWPRTGCTPTRLLADHGLLGPGTTAVHAIHLTDDDVALLGRIRHARLRLPDHRGRPGRRHRAVRRAARPPARRSASAPTSTSRSTCSPRRSGSTSTSGCGPAGGRRSVRRSLLDALAANGFTRARAADGGRIGRGHGRRPGRDPARLARAPPASTPTRRVLVADRGRRAHRRGGRRAGRHATGEHRLGDVGRLLAEAIEPLWADL